MQTVLAEAAARAPGSVKGTPLQQVGDLYASGMDVGRLTLLKAEPIKSEWARIEAIDSKQVLAESIAHFSLVLSDGTMFGSGILPEPRDNTQYTIAFLGATLPMAARENYLSPDMAKVREAYRTMVVKYHLIAGVPLAEAQARADKILAIESRVAGKQLTPEQARNPSLRLKPMTYDALKALVSNFDLDTFYQAMGLPVGHDVYVLDDGNVRERNAILGDLPLADVKVLLQWDLLRGAQPYLTPEFTEPSMEFSRVLYGNMLRLNEFDTRRNLAKFGKPVSEDGFVDPRATLPTVVNAAYSSDRNGIEIPAAFLQPPFYTPNADAGVNFCTLGAVIGHEITHGFDSSGRLYDAQGNVRDWWAPEDTKAFIARSQNLVKQAVAYEVVPVRSGTWHAPERRTVVGREPRGHWRPDAGVRRTRQVPERASEGKPQDRRPDAATALLRRLGPELGRQEAARHVEAGGADRRPSAGLLSHVRARAGRARLLRDIRHQARRQDVGRPEGPRVDLVMAAAWTADRRKK